jgi:glycosyltransferase involved in cell wall biosynthesis
MSGLSVIIPSLDPRFLQKTVDDLIAKAEGEIEVIVVLDGYWPNPMISVAAQAKVIHQNHKGMREAINAGMALAQYDWVMKADEHTMWDAGYDVKLIADAEDDMVVVPRRYRLDPEKWEIIEDGRPPIDYMFIDYPYYKPFDATQGLHGAEWKQPEREDILIDDLMTFQGSAYFMSKKHWERLGGMSTALYGRFTHEAQEISNKTWLGGGRCVVNKKTWYAHLHKGKKYGTGYPFSTKSWQEFKADMEFGRRACLDIWLNNKWEGRVHDWEWLIDKFWPVPHWPDDWREKIIEDAGKDWSKTGEPTWQPKR